MLRPLIFMAPDEPATGGEPAAAHTVTEPAPTVTEPAPTVATHPWDADLAAAFTNEDERARFGAFMTEKYAPYVTRVEAERADALNKAWVFDLLNDDPAAAMREIAPQVWPDMADDIIALVTATADEVEGEAAAAGATPEEAAAAGAAAADTIDLSKLPKEVREAVEFANEQRAAAAAKVVADEEAAATATAAEAYKTWADATLEANPDILAYDLHASVYAAEGDMEAGLAAYRAAHPAPEPAKTPPPTTIGGGTTGGVAASRPSGGSLADRMGEVWDAMAGTAK
jgi:hypothetical protein